MMIYCAPPGAPDNYMLQVLADGFVHLATLKPDSQGNPTIAHSRYSREDGERLFPQHAEAIAAAYAKRSAAP